MNKQKRTDMLAYIEAEDFSEIKTEPQFRRLVSCFCDMKVSDTAAILSQIQEVKKLSDAYFADMMYTVINFEPTIYFELVDAKKYLDDRLKEPIDFKALGRAYHEFSVWLCMEPLVIFSNTPESDYMFDEDLFTVSQVMNIFRDFDDMGKEEEYGQARLLYEGELFSGGMVKEQSISAAEFEDVLEAIIERVEEALSVEDINSRLN